MPVIGFPNPPAVKPISVNFDSIWLQHDQESSLWLKLPKQDLLNMCFFGSHCKWMGTCERYHPQIFWENTVKTQFDKEAAAGKGKYGGWKTKDVCGTAESADYEQSSSSKQGPRTPGRREK